VVLAAVVQAAQGHSDPAPAVNLPLPAAFDAVVVHVTDGDTLVLRDAEGRNLIVRLTDIDAPETSHGRGRPGQPYSTKATTHLRGLALNMTAKAQCYDVDRRQAQDRVRLRYICRVQVRGIDLSLAMIDAGMAMANRQSTR
jgi:endonuclease YncB( thermonuclease family)